MAIATGEYRFVRARMKARRHEGKRAVGATASIIVLSTICCNCSSFRLSPVIIFRTVKSSAFEIYPSLSMS